MICRLIPVALLATLATPVVAQSGSDFRWSGTAAAGTEVSINNINGDIKVTPSTTGKIEVLGVKQGDSQYFDRIRVDVQQTSRGVVICVLTTDNASSCDDQGSHSTNRDRNSGNRDWNHLAINLQVAVPPTLQVGASSVSGDIDVRGAQGDVRANSVSGDIVLDGLHASSVQANTVSGDVVVRVDQFTGNGDLSFNTVSGDVTLEVPRQFDADLSMSTVSGQIDSEFQLVMSGTRMNRRSVDARIGNGGRRLGLNTVSGDLKIRMIK